MNLVERVKNILLQPKSEWAAIEREPGDAGYLFTNYVCIVAAIPPVCSFIGRRTDHPRQVPCHITRTTEATHEIIRGALDAKARRITYAMKCAAAERQFRQNLRTSSRSSVRTRSWPSVQTDRAHSAASHQVVPVRLRDGARYASLS